MKLFGGWNGRVRHAIKIINARDISEGIAEQKNFEDVVKNNTIIVDYNVKDSLLVIKLFEKYIANLDLIYSEIGRAALPETQGTPPRCKDCLCGRRHT